MPLRFGTDGVRGPADQLDDQFVAHLGASIATVLGPGPFVVGRDPRESGPRIVEALVRGFATAGATARSLDVAPTPAVAWVAARGQHPAVMVSASHNPWSDNGVKVFGPGGRKLDDAAEARIEQELTRRLGGPASSVPDAPTPVVPSAADPVAHTDPVADAEPDAWAEASLAAYADALVGALHGRRLDGLHVVLDCANGAASDVAPSVFATLGASVDVIGDRPDGRNINEGCGSTHPEHLAAQVHALGADLGLAFDGDADRLVAVGHDGRVVDGDHLLALFAVDLRARGRLADDTVVVTVMTNLGFHLAMADAGIEVVQTAVGDRYVLEALEAGGWSLGGEQSGHLIFPQLSTTGDGILSGLLLADLVARSGRRLADLAGAVMTQLPQVLRNVPVAVRRPDIADVLAGDIAEEVERFEGRGRVLIRPSGTEPVVRVMVEAPTAEAAEAAASRLCEAVRNAGEAPVSS